MAARPGARVAGRRNRGRSGVVKITDVRAYVVDGVGPAWGGAQDREWTFVRVDTDEGITGWGESTNYPGRATAARPAALSFRGVGESD